MLVLRPAHNTPGKKDVTGAFAPEAERFLQAVCLPGSAIFSVDNRKAFAKRRAEVASIFENATLNMPDTYDGVAFLCHGWSSGVQLGYANKDVLALAQAVTALCEQRARHLRVVLYCCSTGDDPRSAKSSPGTGDNSFADLLRDALCREISEQGITPEHRVVAHTTVAHATKSPHVRFFDGMGSSEGGVGGYRPVKIGGAYWARWKRALRDPKGLLRFQMPFLDIPEIEKALDDLPE